MEKTVLTVAGLFAILIFFHYPAALYGFRRIKSTIRDLDNYPGVSVIKPVKGLDEDARENFITFFRQDYSGSYQVIFSLQDEEDPALPLLYKLQEEFSDLDIKILVNPKRDDMTGKSSNLYYGVKSADYSVLVFSDADMSVHGEFIKNIISPLENTGVGAVSALPLHSKAQGFWSRLYQMQLNSTILAQWLPYAGILKIGAAGGTIAIKREVLEKIGGVESFGSYVVEDVRIGHLVRDAGYRVEVGEPVVSPVGEKSYDDFLSLSARGAIIYRQMFPNILEFLYFIVAYFYLIPGFLFLFTGSTYYLFAFLLHLIGKTVTGFLISRRAGSSGVEAFFVFLSDLLFIYVYIRTFKNKTLAWRNIEYEIDDEGRLKSLQ